MALKIAHSFGSPVTVSVKGALLAGAVYGWLVDGE